MSRHRCPSCEPARRRQTPGAQQLAFWRSRSRLKDTTGAHGGSDPASPRAAPEETTALAARVPQRELLQRQVSASLPSRPTALRKARCWQPSSSRRLRRDLGGRIDQRMPEMRSAITRGKIGGTALRSAPPALENKHRNGRPDSEVGTSRTTEGTRGLAIGRVVNALVLWQSRRDPVGLLEIKEVHERLPAL